MNSFKEKLEIETLKSMTYTEINILLSDLNKENLELKKTIKENTPEKEQLAEFRRFLLDDLQFLLSNTSDKKPLEMTEYILKKLEKIQAKNLPVTDSQVIKP